MRTIAAIAAAALSPVALVALLACDACNSDEGGKPPVAPVTIPATAAAADAGVRPDANVSPDAADGNVSAAVADAHADGPVTTPDFYACAMDSDCVAVPKVGCCNNGYKEAVNKGQAEAYRQSFTCPTPNQMCPHFMVNETRQPECNNGTHKCEMVPIEEIKCGGFIKNQHACPTGFHCKANRIPDVPGKCEKGP